MDENKEKLIAETLKCQSEIKCFQTDYEDINATLEDYCSKKVDEKFPLSSISFPAVIATHSTGSKSEKLWTIDSDTDTIYEIGPALVYLNKGFDITRFFQNLKNKVGASNISFFLEKADHVGHYRVKDSDGGYIYPQDLQTKLLPEFQSVGNIIKTPNKTNASTTLRNQNYHDPHHDHVIGLKIEKWPDSVKNDLMSKLTQSCFEEIKGKFQMK